MANWWQLYRFGSSLGVDFFEIFILAIFCLPQTQLSIRWKTTRASLSYPEVASQSTGSTTAKSSRPMRTPDSTLIETKAKYTSVIYATLKGQGCKHTFISYLSESPLSTPKSCNSWATTSMPDRRYNNAKAFYLSTLLALLLLLWNCTSNAKSWIKTTDQFFSVLWNHFELLQ